MQLCLEYLLISNLIFNKISRLLLPIIIEFLIWFYFQKNYHFMFLLMSLVVCPLLIIYLRNWTSIVLMLSSVFWLGYSMLQIISFSLLSLANLKLFIGLWLSHNFTHLCADTLIIYFRSLVISEYLYDDKWSKSPSVLLSCFPS